MAAARACVKSFVAFLEQQRGLVGCGGVAGRQHTRSVQLFRLSQPGLLRCRPDRVGEPWICLVHRLAADGQGNEMGGGDQ